MNFKLSCLIVDDEPLSRQILIDYLHQHCPYISIQAQAESTYEAMDLIEQLAPDLVFLDIQLPNESGLEMLQRLRNRDFMTVIYSYYSDFALDAIKLHADDYLLKPLCPDELVRTTKRLYNKALEENKDPYLFKKIELFTSGRRYFIRHRDITHVTASGSYAELHFKGSEKLVLSRNLKTVEKMIDNEAFCRIHNSVLINMHYLESVSLKRNKCTLSTGAELPVSARKKEALRERLYGNEEKTIQQEDTTAHGNKMQDTRFKL